MSHATRDIYYDQVVNSFSSYLDKELIETTTEPAPCFYRGREDLDWSRKELSLNPCIPEDLILHNSSKLDMKILSFNKSVSMSFIESNPQLDWDFYYLAERDDLTKSLFLKRIDKFTPHLKEISSRSFLTPEIIDMFPPESWNLEELCRNTSIPVEFILNRFTVDHEKDKFYGWQYLSARAPIDFIEANLHLPWSPLYIHKNPQLTTEFVERNIDMMFKKCRNLRYRDLLFLTPRFVERHNELSWNFEKMGQNPSLPPEYLLSKFYKPTSDFIISLLQFTNDPIRAVEICIKNNFRIYWGVLFLNKNLTLDMVRSRPDWPWDFTNLINNNDILKSKKVSPIPFDLFMHFRDNEWDWCHVSMFLEFPDEFDPQILRDYPFVFHLLFMNASLKYKYVKDYEEVDQYADAIYRNPKMAIDAYNDGKVPVSWPYFSMNPVIFKGF